MATQCMAEFELTEYRSTMIQFLDAAIMETTGVVEVHVPMSEAALLSSAKDLKEKQIFSAKDKYTRVLAFKIAEGGGA